MRITQSMLSMNTLRHISQGYERLGKTQDQLTSGKKITRISQDPIVAMNGMRYRSQVVEIEQFQRNLGEVYSWLNNGDSTLDETTKALHRIRELAVQASNDTYEETQRANVAKEIDQLLEHVKDLANTKSNNKYLFNGTDTMNAPIDREKLDLGVVKINDYIALGEEAELEVSFAGNVYTFDTLESDDIVFKNGDETITISNFHTPNPTVIHTHSNSDGGDEVTESLYERDIVLVDRKAVSINTEKVNIELIKGVNLNVNISPQNVFNNALFGDILSLKKLLEDPNAEGKDISKGMEVLDKHINNLVSERAELGARINRVEMIENRLMEQEVIANRIMSNNEDVDFEKAIIDLTTQENVHRAALAAGARILQPTLIDFLR